MSVVQILEDMIRLLSEDLSSKDDFDDAIPLWMKMRQDRADADQAHLEKMLKLAADREAQQQQKAKLLPKHPRDKFEPPEYQPASDEYLAAQARYIASKKHPNPPVGWKPHMDKGKLSNRGWSDGGGDEPLGEPNSMPKFRSKGLRLYYD
jgi:hypothetical protein